MKYSKSYLGDQWMYGCCYSRLTGFYYKIMTVAQQKKEKKKLLFFAATGRVTNKASQS